MDLLFILHKRSSIQDCLNKKKIETNIKIHGVVWDYDLDKVCGFFREKKPSTRSGQFCKYAHGSGHGTNENADKKWTHVIWSLSMLNFSWNN